jgi:hypothetical protein
MAETAAFRQAILDRTAATSSASMNASLLRQPILSPEPSGKGMPMPSPSGDVDFIRRVAAEEVAASKGFPQYERNVRMRKHIFSRLCLSFSLSLSLSLSPYLPTSLPPPIYLPTSLLLSCPLSLSLSLCPSLPPSPSLHEHREQKHLHSGPREEERETLTCRPPPWKRLPPTGSTRAPRTHPRVHSLDSTSPTALPSLGYLAARHRRGPERRGRQGARRRRGHSPVVWLLREDARQEGQVGVWGMGRGKWRGGRLRVKSTGRSS